MEIQVQYTAPVVTQLDQIGLSATLVLGANLLLPVYIHKITFYITTVHSIAIHATVEIYLFLSIPFSSY